LQQQLTKRFLHECWTELTRKESHVCRENVYRWNTEDTCSEWNGRQWAINLQEISQNQKVSRIGHRVAMVLVAVSVSCSLLSSTCHFFFWWTAWSMSHLRLHLDRG
jgi:hypothetical protein